jgi:hypothetical protein
MKRRMSQGQAMRSIFGRARVTHTVRPFSSREGKLVGADEHFSRLAPSLEAAFERLRLDALVAHPGGNALAQLQALLAHDDHAFTGIFGRPDRYLLERPAHCARQ